MVQTSKHLLNIKLILMYMKRLVYIGLFYVCDSFHVLDCWTSEYGSIQEVRYKLTTKFTGLLGL
jgi:hypothetical protein